jgi:hypothetical protein
MTSTASRAPLPRNCRGLPVQAPLQPLPASLHDSDIGSPVDALREEEPQGRAQARARSYAAQRRLSNRTSQSLMRFQLANFRLTKILSDGAGFA